MPSSPGVFDDPKLPPSERLSGGEGSLPGDRLIDHSEKFSVASSLSSPISGGYPDVIPTAFLLGALRLADRHTARLISEGIIDRNSAEAVIGEVEAALMAIHPGLFSTVFPEVTTRSIPPGN